MQKRKMMLLLVKSNSCYIFYQFVCFLRIKPRPGPWHLGHAMSIELQEHEHHFNQVCFVF